MSSVIRRVIARLSYANVMATLAVFLVLGGGAYAAATLPAHSVGKQQLRKGAVTRPKLAPRSVHTAKLARDAVAARKLSPGVRARARARRSRRPGRRARPRRPRRVPAPPGSPSPRPRPPRRSPSPCSTSPGCGSRAAARPPAGTVSLPISITAAEASQAQETIAIDTGTDPSNGGATQVGNLQFDLPAGARARHRRSGRRRAPTTSASWPRSSSPPEPHDHRQRGRARRRRDPALLDVRDGRQRDVSVRSAR